MTGHQRLRAITRRIHRQQFTPEVRDLIRWAKALNRPVETGANIPPLPPMEDDQVATRLGLVPDKRTDQEKRDRPVNEPRKLEAAIPLHWTGWGVSAQQALSIPARDVVAGDVLILDRFVSRVYQVTIVEKAKEFGECSVVWIHGDLNIFRGTHELMSVLRPDNATERWTP